MEIWFLMLETTRAGWNLLESVMVADVRREMEARRRKGKVRARRKQERIIS